MAEQRTPIIIEGFSLGDEGKPNHFNALASREEAAAAAKDLEVGDAAFIKRSDLKWTYAIVAEKVTEDKEGVILRFDVDMDKNRKSFPEKQWGKYIRVIQIEGEPTTAAPQGVKEEKVKEEKPKPAEKPTHDDDSTKVSTLSDSLEAVEKPKQPAVSQGWFTGLFSAAAAASQQSHPTVSTNNSLKESVEMQEAAAVVEASVEVEAPVALEKPVVEEEEDKENDAPVERKRSIFQKISFSRSSSKQKKVTIDTPSTPKIVENAKEKSTKEWFDPLASEVDYDKDPTDLFQALEARQWEYALAMVVNSTVQFNKECSTWVVAKGKKKGAALRFRALPLHAAVVFGAPDNLTKAILHAYPLGARGRDVKGRLPCHLACEHEVSDEVLFMVINAFPKAFYAKDKLEKTPLDYMNDNGRRQWIKKLIPLLISAKLEDEKAKWEAEKEQALINYREALKSDPEYTKEVNIAVEKANEVKYANKFELIELSHKKEIELLKMKHADETRALLEGFEVKLNFERKLQSLKSNN
ncbi:hypothetical protein ACHAXM_010662 [Skeletonema potamos]